MKLILIIQFLLISCQENKTQRNQRNFAEVDRKFCIKSCIEEQFKNFHNNSGMFGESSSMNGLGSSEIYLQVYRLCDTVFIGGESCWEYKDWELYKVGSSLWLEGGLK